MTIGDPINHRCADARHSAKRRADRRAPKNQEPVSEGILDTLYLPKSDILFILILHIDRLLGDRHIGELCAQ